jgi:phage shock protein A
LGKHQATFFLKLIKMDAAQNPIETMQDLWRSRGEQIAAAETQLRKFSGNVEDYTVQVVALKKKYPQEASRFEQHLAAMVELRRRRYEALSGAKTELGKYYEGIQRADAIWNMTKASNALSDAAGQLSSKDAVAQIRSDEAIKAVELSMAQSFADLNHMLQLEVQEPAGFIPTESAVKAAVTRS